MGYRAGFVMRATKTEHKWVMDRQRFLHLSAGLKPGEYDITVEKHVSARSVKQNRAYWACIVTPISEHTGYEPDEVHELLKRFCNPKTVGVVNKATGEVEDVEIGGSTTAMNVEEFNLYFRRCQQFAAERLDVYCPDPDPEWAFNAA